MNPGNNNEMETASLKNIEQEAVHKVTDPGGISVEKFNNIEDELIQEKKKIENQRKIQEKKEGILAKLGVKVKELFCGDEKNMFMEDMNKKMNSWITQGKVNKPTEKEAEAILQEAEKDKYRGRIGVSGNTIIYRPSDSIKWGTNERTFGSGE